eukprot:6206177-Pleurochrysis_carterae.AAC.3
MGLANGECEFGRVLIARMGARFWQGGADHCSESATSVTSSAAREFPETSARRMAWEVSAHVNAPLTATHAFRSCHRANSQAQPIATEGR